MNPTLSRSLLDVGSVFYYREFEGVDGIKSRYFIVVDKSDDCTICCLTTTTNLELLSHPRLRTEVSELIIGRSTCLPSDCIVDFRHVYDFDDILLTNRINNKRIDEKCVLACNLLLAIARRLAASSMISDEKIDRIVDSITSKCS